jgi:hypothetical protein
MPAGLPRVGWKVGRGIVEGEEHLEPVLGYLTELSDGALDPGEARELRVDAEVAVEVGSGRVAAALELVDLARPPDDFETIVAENVWHRGVAFGPFTAEPPPDGFRTSIVVNGETRGETTGSVDVEETVRIAHRLLPTVGEEPRPGDRIIAGSILQVPVAPGEEVAVDLGALGRVTAHVE